MNWLHKEKFLLAQVTYYHAVDYNSLGHTDAIVCEAAQLIDC